MRSHESIVITYKNIKGTRLRIILSRQRNCERNNRTIKKAANMNTTYSGSTCFSSMNPSAVKIGETVAYCLILVVSLVGNSFLAIIVYKTQILRKPINFFIANMAMSDLLYPIHRQKDHIKISLTSLVMFHCVVTRL